MRQLAGLQPSPNCLPPESVLQWATEEVRAGSLAGPVRQFLSKQPEICAQDNVVVESVTPEWITCIVAAVAEDSEAKSPFTTEVKFKVQPIKARVERLN